MKTYQCNCGAKFAINIIPVYCPACGRLNDMKEEIGKQYQSLEFPYRWGEIYNVNEDWSGDEYPEWYEYRIYKVDLFDNSRIIKEWDSFYETYNGAQKLTRSEAWESLKKTIEMEDLF